MYTIDRCQCCGGRELTAYPAGVAPFIVEYVLGGIFQTSRLMECRVCAFRFYETRFDESESSRCMAGTEAKGTFKYAIVTSLGTHEPSTTVSRKPVGSRNVEPKWLNGLIRTGAPTFGAYLTMEATEDNTYRFARVSTDLSMIFRG